MLSISHSYPQDIDAALQEQAITLWQKGQLVAFPTETVYGLGADARNSEAVARIYEVKSRPRFNPLIVHVASIEAAKRYVEWTDTAERLSQFWPGPLTLVLKKREGISDLVSAGGDTIGIRIPAHPIALKLLAAFDGPICAPSANRSGRISPTTAAHVESELGGRIPLIIDGGPCQVGLESSVVDATGDVPILLRPGIVTREMLESSLSLRERVGVREAGDGHILQSPGQLESHYAPETALRLNANDIHKDEGLLAFGPTALISEYSINLSPSGNLLEAATHLFSALRTLDAKGLTSIAVTPIPNEGIGEAINDRLSRAAHR